MAACAPQQAHGTNVQVLVRSFISGNIVNRAVTFTLTAPGQSVAGPWVFPGDSVTQFTDGTGQTTFTNMLSLGEYRMDIAGNPSRSYPFSLSVTNGTFNVVQLIGTNNSVEVFYDSAQVDALIAAAQLGNTNFLNNTVTNTVQGILAGSNQFKGTFIGNATLGTNALFAAYVTNAIFSGVKGTNTQFYVDPNQGVGDINFYYNNGQVLATMAPVGFALDSTNGQPVISYTATPDDLYLADRNGNVRFWSRTNGVMLLDQAEDRRVLVSTNGVLVSGDSSITGGTPGNPVWSATTGIFVSTNYIVLTNATGQLLLVGTGLTNSGPVQATAFYGPLHGNADTATFATSSSWTTNATNASFSAFSTNAFAVTNSIWAGTKGTNSDWYVIPAAPGSQFTMHYGHNAFTPLFTAQDTGWSFGDGGSGLPVMQWTIAGDDFYIANKNGQLRLWGNTNGLSLLDQANGIKEVLSTNGVLILADSLNSGGPTPGAATTGLFGTTNYWVLTNATGKLIFVGTGVTNSGPIQATAFYGPLHGNADTATTAQFATLATNALNAPISTNAIFAGTATNLVASPNLTNATSWQGFTARYNNGVAAYNNGSSGLFLETAGGNPAFEWLFAGIGGGTTADQLIIGHDGGTVFSSDTNNGTAIYDTYGSNHITIKTNSVAVNTNFYVWSGTFTNGLTNQAWTANTALLADGNKGASSLANGGANTFLQGTTPPSYTSIPDGALSSNVPFKNGANVFSSTNSFQNVGVGGTGGGILTGSNVFAFVNLFDDGLSANAIPYGTTVSGHTQLSGLAAGGANTVVHGTSPPAYSAVVEADLSLSDVTTANASTSRHGFMPKGDASANHFFNGNNALTSIPDAALSANVTLDNANNTLTGNNTLSGQNLFSGVTAFGAQVNSSAHFGVDNLTVTNGITNVALTANSLVYADNGSSGPRLTSVPAGGASQYMKAGMPPSFQTISGSDISGAVGSAGSATFAFGLATNAPGTNNIFYGDLNETNALAVHKWVTISNNLGRVDFYAGSQTNTGSITITNTGSINSTDGRMFLGGNPTMPDSVVPGVGGYPFLWIEGNFTGNASSQQNGLYINPTYNQGSSEGYGALVVNVNEVTTGTGAKDLLELQKGGGLYMNVDHNGNQTNFGNMQASAFYGPLHGNADTASTVTSATYARVATNLVQSAVISNTTVRIDSAGAGFTVIDTPSSGAVMLTMTTGGAIQMVPNGGTIFNYTPGGSDVVWVGRAGNNAFYANSTDSEIRPPSNLSILKVANQLVTIATNTTVTAPLNYQLSIVSKTANYNVVVGDSGTRFNNNGSVVATTNSLPAAAAGLHYGLDVVAGQNVAFKANTGDTIRSVGTVSGSGGLVFSSTVGSTLHLFCPASGGWWIDSTNGTWTIQ